MNIPYNQKRVDLSCLTKRVGLSPSPELDQFCERLCHPPFPKHLGSARLWLSLWNLLDETGRRSLISLPDPCLNHVEVRLRKPQRAEHLSVGLERLLRHDQLLLLQGLRLYPHAVCRTAETIGPLDDSKWQKIETDLRRHRLWTVKKNLTEAEFWETAEFLEDFRDLPQPLLDHLDLDRPREKAPIADFIDSLQKFLLRGRIEKIRSATYELLRGCKPTRPVRPTSA